MIRFLRWLWFGDGHKHEYRFLEQLNVYVHDYDKRPIYTKRVHVCSVCGKVKKYKV